MKVSRKWLEKFFDAPLPSAEELSNALTFHAFEIDGVEKVGPRQGDAASDDVLDVKVTPNRGHDCLCHRGIAKELSAILKIPFAHDPYTTYELPICGNAESPSESEADTVSVDLKTPLCKRYIAAHIKGVKVGPSPKWLQERLEAIGQRSINNVVDATNFVMFNTGQPLHAFDAGKLSNKEGKYAIEVRTANAGEKMLALDGKEYELKDSMLVIADANGSGESTEGGTVIGLAGVKGGMPSGISESTTDIIVESANFDGVTTRKTAAALKLRTDASSRFEQVISPELCAYGIAGMMEFVQNVTGGELVSLVDIYPEPQQQTYVSVTVEQINNVLGTSVTGAEVSDVFVRLGFPYKEQEGVFEVQPPAERLDLTIPEDLIEEVGRILGYDAVPATPLPVLNGDKNRSSVNPEFYAAEQIREELLNQGYSEVFTSVFAESGERTVLNKVDGIKPHLRSDLKTGLLEAWNKNQPNKDLLGLKEIKLFEIGAVWINGKEEIHTATVDGKGKVEEKELQPIQTTDGYENLPLSTAPQYKPFSRYPYIVRDVAFWVTGDAEQNEVQDLIKQEAGELCSTISLFDRFQKGDKTSLGFRLIFQSFDRTLADTEANASMEKVYAALKAKGFEIR